jgi:hypothetical protein
MYAITAKNFNLFTQPIQHNVYKSLGMAKRGLRAHYNRAISCPDTTADLTLTMHKNKKAITYRKKATGKLWSVVFIAPPSPTAPKSPLFVMPKTN